MPATLVDFSTNYTSSTSSAVTVTLTSAPAAGDVLVVLGAAGPPALSTPTLYVETDDPDSVVLDVGIDQDDPPASVACRLIRCAGSETEVTFGVSQASPNLVVGVWRITDEAQIEPYPTGSSDGAGTTPEVPGYTTAAAGFALHLLVAYDLTLPAPPAGWTVDETNGVTISWEFLSIASAAGAAAADPYGGTVDDAWSSVVVAVSDLGVILAPMSATGTVWGARVAGLAPAEIPPPLDPYYPEYPPQPPESPSEPLPLPPWIPGPQYRPETP